MAVVYKDEYGVSLYWGSVVHPANVGDTVIIEDEEYRVKSRIFIPEKDQVIIVVTQNMLKASIAESSDNGRQTQMHNAIIELTKRQDTSEKKARMLGEQVSTVKKFVNRKIQQDKKET